MASAVVKTESGIDLLQRLSLRPKLIGLQVEVFGENGPQPGDIIEISEKNTYLKTLLLTQWIMACILPSVWKGIKIGGLDVGVVFLSTDHHFSPLHLYILLEKRVRRILRQSQDLIPGSKTSMVKEITMESLKRLTVYESFNKTELLFNFCSAKTYLLSHPQYSVVIIDSLSAYYWEDRLSSASLQSLEKYCQSLLTSLIERLKQTNITIIYTVQQFLRETHVEKETETPLYIYSLSLDIEPGKMIHVEDRRNVKTFSKTIEVFNTELLIK